MPPFTVSVPVPNHSARSLSIATFASGVSRSGMSVRSRTQSSPMILVHTRRPLTTAGSLLEGGVPSNRISVASAAGKLELTFNVPPSQTN